jgi:hypothetical protein
MTNVNNLFAAQANSRSSQSSTDQGVQHMQQGFQEAQEFQLWASQQAQALGRVKVFSTMAKTINDQQ